MLRVPFDQLHAALLRAMQQLGLTHDRATLCARLFAETTRDGVYTHGLNRFPRFVETIRNGSIDINAEPTKTTGIGAIERWDGHRGVGNLNAHASMHRAIALAKHNGIGAVALANTNHWMRGGTYGWQAAEQGLFAIRRPSGHVVLDMAMSQFSYGALSAYSKRKQLLPVDGGFDTTGHLTRDAAAIEASQRALPVGYWKGSGLSLVLDMLAAMLSGGLATHQIPLDPARESGLSQVFLAIDPSSVANPKELAQIADGVLNSLRQATPVDPDKPIRYPGEQTLQLREENLRLGVPVDPEIWAKISTPALPRA